MKKMSTKTKLSLAGLLIAVTFTTVMLIVILHNWDNKRHTVTFFQGHTIEGYEGKAAVAQVNISPAIAWDKTNGWAKAAGFIFLLAMWVGVVLIDTKLDTLPAGGKAAVILGPLVISAAFFFSAYSSKYSSNYVEVFKDRFDSWVSSGAVIKRGERTYVDNRETQSDTLKTLFNKKLIK